MNPYPLKNYNTQLASYLMKKVFSKFAIGTCILYCIATYVHDPLLVCISRNPTMCTTGYFSKIGSCAYILIMIVAHQLYVLKYFIYLVGFKKQKLHAYIFGISGAMSNLFNAINFLTFLLLIIILPCILLHSYFVVNVSGVALITQQLNDDQLVNGFSSS